MDLEREPALSDIIRDWLFENKIESTEWTDSIGSRAEVRGFGWVIEINNVSDATPKATLSNRFDNEIIIMSAADPAIFDKLTSKILQVEASTINYIIEHVDDDGWKDWKPPQESI